MDDTTPTRNKQILDESSDDTIENAASDLTNGPSAVQKGISGIQNGVKGAINGISGFTHKFIGGIASAMGIPSKAVSLLMAMMMGTTTFAAINTSDTSTDSTPIRSETVETDKLVNHPNEQKSYFDTLTALEKVDSAHKIYNYFKSLDYTDESIAGILSNIEAESGLMSDYYTGKEISLYNKVNQEYPDGMSGNKPLMYEAFYERDWSAYAAALYDEYKSGEGYMSRGISNFARYQALQGSSNLDTSCFAVNNKAAGAVTSYLPGFGLFQFAGDRAKDYAYFANCQTIHNDYNYDKLNDQWISTPLQIAYLYFENKECEPGVRVNDWGTTDYYGTYGKKEIVNAFDTYETHMDDPKYHEPENWRMAHCVNSMTSTGNVVYEYFTITIDETEEESWSSEDDDCSRNGLDGVTKHDVQEVKYTMKYKPMLYTFVIDKSKLSAGTDKSNYNDDAYLKEVNTQLKTLSSTDAVEYMKTIGGSSFEAKSDFLKDEEGNVLDYAGKFETTSYWKWQDEDETVYKNEAPNSEAVRNAYAEWQKAIKAYNDSVANLKSVETGHEELKLLVGRYKYAEQLKAAQNQLFIDTTAYMNDGNYYTYSWNGIGYSWDDKNNCGRFGNLANPDVGWSSGWNSFSPSGMWNPLGYILNDIWNIKKALRSTVSGNEYGVAYSYNPDNDDGFDNATQAEADNWCNGLSLTYSDGEAGRWFTCWAYGCDAGTSVGDDFVHLVDVCNNRREDAFYNAVLNVRNAGATNNFVDFIIDPNPGYGNADNYKNAVEYYTHDGKGWGSFTDSELTNAENAWREAAKTLDTTYNDFLSKYNSYKVEYDMFMNNRQEHSVKDIDYFSTSVDDLYKNVGTQGSNLQAVNGNDFYNNASLKRDDPKRFSEKDRGFDTYWYLHDPEIGTNTFPAWYSSDGKTVYSDPAESNNVLTVSKSGGGEYTYTMSGTHSDKGNYSFVVDGTDVYSKYSHRYDIYWKDTDYSFDMFGTEKEDEDFPGVKYKELKGGAGKTNGYKGYLLNASYEFDHIMNIQSRPANTYQDGEDMAFQNAIYFYENYLGYDPVDDPFAALTATSTGVNDKNTIFRNHCKKARYWYQIIIKEKWADQLKKDNAKQDYKNEIYSHLPKNSSNKPVWCKTDADNGLLYSNTIVDDFNIREMSRWGESSGYELYNYHGNVFDNSSLAATAISMSYPYGYNNYAVDDGVTKLNHIDAMCKDSEWGGRVQLDSDSAITSNGSIGRRCTLMNCAVTTVSTAFARLMDKSDSFAQAYSHKELDEKLDARGVSLLEMEHDEYMDVLGNIINDISKPIFRLNSPEAAICSAVRASGRDDNFPGTFYELYSYLGLFPYDEYSASRSSFDEKNFTTDIDIIKERLSVRNEEDFDESKWSLLDLFRKKKKPTPDEEVEKQVNGAGKWEVKGILTEDIADNTHIPYTSLKPGDICVSLTGIFMFVGTEANTKFMDYSEFAHSKYAVCYAECDVPSFSEWARQAGWSVPAEGAGLDAMSHQFQLSVDNGTISPVDSFTSTGLVCRELYNPRDHEDYYIKHLIKESMRVKTRGSISTTTPYIVFRSINDDFELSNYYKLLNSCDFRAYQDGRRSSEITFSSAIPLSHEIAYEQGVGSTTYDGVKSAYNKLTYVLGPMFNKDDDEDTSSPISDLLNKFFNRT